MCGMEMNLASWLVLGGAFAFVAYTQWVAWRSFKEFERVMDLTNPWRG